jgi:hypothetical protein
MPNVKVCLEGAGATMFMPWPEAEITASGFEMPAGMAMRLLLMYADGATSNSHVYRFLCFFKVVDHVLRVGGPQLRAMREERFRTRLG